MDVKKTKAVRFSIGLNLHEREELHEAILESIEDFKLQHFIKASKVVDAIYYTTLIHIAYKKNFNTNFLAPKRILFDLHEAVALMWMLRRFDHSTSLLNLKNSLHKSMV